MWASRWIARGILSQEAEKDECADTECFGKDPPSRSAFSEGDYFAFPKVRGSSNKMVLQSSTNTEFDASGKSGMMIFTLGLQ